MAKQDDKGNLHSNLNGRFVSKGEQEAKREEAEKIYNSDSSVTASSEKKKKTPAEKIASVHIDFSRDNILPELNEEDLKKVGVKENKPVLLKKDIIDRNFIQHSDLTNEDFQTIIAHALYAPSEIFLANDAKPYYHFAKVIEVTSKNKPKMGLVLLDVDDKKYKFEIVHAHFMEIPRFNKTREKKKD